MRSPPERPPRATFLGFQPPAIGEEEGEAVAETLRSGWLTSGPRAAELERRFAEYAGAKHALALSSGTAALHLALLAVGVGPGDEVITSPITWPATANVIVHAGARPVFADVRDSDLNVDPARVAEAVTERTKVILPVHLAGQPCDMDPLLALGLPVVEDAAHAARGRVGLRRGRSRLQGEPLRRPGLDRARPARQGRPAPRDPGASIRALRRGPRRPGRDRAARARPPRRARAPPVRRPRRRRPRRRDARRLPARARRGA